MPESSGNWVLLGYDFSQGVETWKAVWRQFLWGDDSPLKQQLDSIVRAHHGDQTRAYRAGIPLAPQASVTDPVCDAIILPESLILNKTVEIPVAAERDIESVMAMEVAANSPFPAGDTESGWRLLDRSGGRRKVELVIVSRPAVLQYLQQEFHSTDASAFEIWAQLIDTDGRETIVVIAGFGNRARHQHYRRNLLKLGAVCAYCLGILVLMAVVYAGVNFLQLRSAEEFYRSVEAQSAKALKLRKELTAVNEMLETGRELVADYPSPHRELMRLSTALGDNAWLLNLQMEKRSIQIQGRGRDMANEMLQLTEIPAYEAVQAQGDIRTIGGGALEQFSFNITLADSE